MSHQRSSSQFLRKAGPWCTWSQPRSMDNRSSGNHQPRSGGVRWWAGRRRRITSRRTRALGWGRGSWCQLFAPRVLFSPSRDSSNWTPPGSKLCRSWPGTNQWTFRGARPCGPCLPTRFQTGAGTDLGSIGEACSNLASLYLTSSNRSTCSHEGPSGASIIQNRT